LKRWSIVAAAALVVAVACSTEDFVESELASLDDGAREGVSKSVQVDGSQAQLIALKTGATLTIPKSAVDHQLTVGMERPDDKKALTLVKSVKSLDALASAPYVLTPHGTKFKEPVTVEIPVGKSTKKLVVGWLEDEDDTEWKKLGTPEVSEGKAKIKLDHFSVLVVLEEEGAGLSDEAAADAGADALANSDGPPDASYAQPEEAGKPGMADAGVSLPMQPPDAMPPDTAPGKDAGTSGSTDAGSPSYPDAGAMLDAGLPIDAWVDPGDTAAPLDTGASMDDDAWISDDDAGTEPPDAGAEPPDTGAEPPDAAELQDAAAQLPDAQPV
jgi:ZU5 domain